MKPSEAWDLVGGLSAPSKMPCHGYSIPARHCITGSKLAKVKGSVCSGCYALKGRYLFGNVQSALDKRFESLQSVQWVDAMVTAISHYEKSGFFRWHDSGDLQGVWHLAKIVSVCEQLPEIRFWLPTREMGIVSEFIERGGLIPENLTIRLSAFMVNERGPESFAIRKGLQLSEVSSDKGDCPSYEQGGKCLACRRCWDKSVFRVTYKKH